MDGNYKTLWEGENEIDAFKSFTHWSDYIKRYADKAVVSLWKNDQLLYQVFAHQEVEAYNLPHTD